MKVSDSELFRIIFADSRCILLSATPYNKSYLDLSAQLRLFVSDDRDIGIRPEKFLREYGETEFQSVYQSSLRSLAAFEKSLYADDWRDLMRLFLIRRTRSFIQENYATSDATNNRKFLLYPDGKKFYFPTREPVTLKYEIDEDNPNDQYSKLSSAEVVSTIEKLWLPRYGLGNFVSKSAEKIATLSEKRQLEGLSRAGKRLMGFSRTNLFKRLESGGTAFLLSIERHVLRNFIFLYAIENKLPLPIGSQSAEYLDTTRTDQDETEQSVLFDDAEIEDTEHEIIIEKSIENQEFLSENHSLKEYKKRAAEIYQTYQTVFARRFKWINSKLFKPSLAQNLKEDAENLCKLLDDSGKWNPERDTKFARLLKLIQVDHPTQKILVFTQFADTANFSNES